MAPTEQPTTLDLVSLYAGLPVPDGSHYSAIGIPGIEHHRLAKGEREEPSLLIAVAEDAGHRPAPVELQHLRILYDADCRITEADGSSSLRRFTVVTCTSAEDSLRQHFLAVAGPTVLLLGSQPSREDVHETIHNLVELFRAISAPPRGSVQGLWAELFVIANAPKPAQLVAAWHSEAEDRYDFSTGTQRVEVKAAAGSPRQHHFSLEQLRPPTGTRVLVASVLVERAGAGVALKALYEQVRTSVMHDPELLLRFEHTLLSALGANSARAMRETFDWQRSEDTLDFFDAHRIPSVEPALPDGVTQVRFVSDLEAVPAVDRDRWRTEGGLFEAALPR